MVLVGRQAIHQFCFFGLIESSAERRPLPPSQSGQAADLGMDDTSRRCKSKRSTAQSHGCATPSIPSVCALAAPPPAHNWDLHQSMQRAQAPSGSCLKRNLRSYLVFDLTMQQWRKATGKERPHSPTHPPSHRPTLTQTRSLTPTPHPSVCAILHSLPPFRPSPRPAPPPISPNNSHKQAPTHQRCRHEPCH